LPPLGQQQDLQGSGCCATDARNQLAVSFGRDGVDGLLWRVRLRVGRVVGGTFTGISDRIIAYDSTGSFELTPSELEVAVHEQAIYTFTWSVPEPQRWRDLQALELRVRDAMEVVLWLRFDETSNTFSLVNPATGRVGKGFAAGSPNALQTPQAMLHLADTSVVASGPDSPTVTLNLPLSFKPSTAGRSFIVEVTASDDEGNQPDFEQAGTLTVTPVK
jgi:hypothetical protein